ncbi:MAG: hypothetical protein UIH27_09120, partial [Ruminococcus sp.]|nr:hypothetical protein [Ruminococcus sp.]
GARLAFSYSVSLPKKSRQGDSLTSIYLYNLTKNLTAQSAHLNYAVLPLRPFDMMLIFCCYFLVALSEKICYN